MKSLSLGFLALQGVSAFPGVLNTLNERQASGQPGCSTSSLCNQLMDVSDADIDYDPENPTEAQKASAARPNCGALNPCTIFDEEAQLVSTDGDHAFQAPSESDIRGPCPALNAAANHGYLHRNGVQGLTNTITGLGELYGMSTDLAGFLAAYSIALDGDLISLSWSIGGPPPKAIPLLDSSQGISWSHNKYEGDSSIGRCDAYINGGDAHSLSTAKFQRAFESGMDNDRYTMDKFDRAFTKNSVQSVATNPQFFAPLFSTTLVSPAAYHFVIAMMSNHTEDEVSGYLDGDMFKTWFSIEGEYPDFKWNPGMESIPENWYRRPRSQPYTAFAGVFGDLIPEYLAYPQSFKFGGNTDGVNTYTGIDLADFTGGVYNAQNLMDPETLACFMYQNIQQGLPDAFSANPLLTNAVSFLTDQMSDVFGALACPEVSKFNNNNLPPYPGREYSPNPPADAPNNC